MASTYASPAKAVTPSPQEVARKLSMSNKPTKKPNLPPVSPSIANAHSGNESDSDSLLSPDLSSTSLAQQAGTSVIAPPPLTSIAEAPGPIGSGGEESDEDEEDGDIWRIVDKAKTRDTENETDLKAGYLWKKGGGRRKTWKKRWFVLRTLHLAYYKTSAEYKLLRLLDLNEIHAVTPCALKRHTYTFGLVSPSRTFYLQAASQADLESWVKALNEVREALLTTSTVTAAEAPTPPIPVPKANNTISGGGMTPTGSSMVISSSPLSRRSHSPGHYITSSDDDDFTPQMLTTNTPLPLNTTGLSTSNSSKIIGGNVSPKDPTKPVLSGYLMKCGQNRRTWRKRWFVLTGQKLLYSGSHMDTKPHREIDLEQILDALEYDAFSQGSNVYGHHAGPNTSHGINTNSMGGDETAEPKHTFKIVTTKRSLLLSAPSEVEEIKWLSTVRALIARRASTTMSSTSGATPGGPTRNAQPSLSSMGQTPIKGSAGTNDQSRGSSSGSNSGSKTKRGDAEAGHTRVVGSIAGEGVKVAVR